MCVCLRVRVFVYDHSVLSRVLCVCMYVCMYVYIHVCDNVIYIGAVLIRLLFCSILERSTACVVYDRIVPTLEGL